MMDATYSYSNLVPPPGRRYHDNVMLSFPAGGSPPLSDEPDDDDDPGLEPWGQTRTEDYRLERRVLHALLMVTGSRGGRGHRERELQRLERRDADVLRSLGVDVRRVRALLGIPAPAASYASEHAAADAAAAWDDRKEQLKSMRLKWQSCLVRYEATRRKPAFLSGGDNSSSATRASSCGGAEWFPFFDHHSVKRDAADVRAAAVAGGGEEDPEVVRRRLAALEGILWQQNNTEPGGAARLAPLLPATSTSPPTLASVPAPCPQPPADNGVASWQHPSFATP